MSCASPVRGRPRRARAAPRPADRLLAIPQRRRERHLEPEQSLARTKRKRNAVQPSRRSRSRRRRDRSPDASRRRPGRRAPRARRGARASPLSRHCAAPRRADWSATPSRTSTALSDEQATIAVPQLTDASDALRLPHAAVVRASGDRSRRRRRRRRRRRSRLREVAGRDEVPRERARAAPPRGPS